MLNRISWHQFLLAVAILTMAYYLCVLIIFYGKDILVLLNTTETDQKGK